MGKLRDCLRPIFRVLTHKHIKKLCKKTEEEFFSYKDRFLGKSCFIVANGPSLRMSDLDFLFEHNVITFGMNRIYELYDRTKWRPTFYLSQDPRVIRHTVKEVREQVDTSIVFVKVPGEKKYDIPKAINYDLDYSNTVKNIPPKFYNGDNCVFADGKSVTYSAIQLAAFMGFSKIYLIGCDCNYSNDNKTISVESYPDPRMYDSKKVGDPPDMVYTFWAYESAKKYADEHNFEIINATRGGLLNVYKRENLDDLFRRIEQHKNEENWEELK